MDLVSDIGTELALACLIEKRYPQKLRPVEAVYLIDRVKELLERIPANEHPRKTRSVTLPPMN